MLMHLDINHRFGLVYVTNTMVEKEKCVSISEHQYTSYIVYYYVYTGTSYPTKRSFLNQDLSPRFSFSISRLKKKRKEKERALILSLFIQSNKAKKVGFFSILPSDRQINWSARERTGQIILSLLHFSARAVSIPLSSSLIPSPRSATLELIRK